MSDKLEFKNFCLESYKQAHNMNGRDTAALFRKYAVLQYIDSFFDVLHSTGQKYIVEDIDLFIEARK